MCGAGQVSANNSLELGFKLANDIMKQHNQQYTTPKFNYEDQIKD